jgi:hypothetical protein
MNDLLEHDLREALADRAERTPPEAVARLRAVDYHPRSRRFPSRPVIGAFGLSGAAAAAAVAIVLGSSAAPAFAGWSARPTAPAPGQLATADQQCGTGDGTPVLTDTRGPYTASIYANGSTCVQGNGITINSSRSGGGPSTVPAGAIELGGAGEADSDGNSLTMVDGPIGSGVTGVSIARSDGSTVQATVQNGWYLAWWPGSEHAVTAAVATANGTSTQSFPSAPNASGSPPCPAGSHCQSGYGFGSGGAKGSSQSMGASAGSSSSSNTRSGY